MTRPPDGWPPVSSREPSARDRPILTDQKYKVSLAGKLLPKDLATREVGYCEAGRLYGKGKWLLLGDACGEDAKNQINSQETQTGLLAALTFTVASACLFALDGNRSWDQVRTLPRARSQALTLSFVRRLRMCGADK